MLVGNSHSSIHFTFNPNKVYTMARYIADGLAGKHMGTLFKWYVVSELSVLFVKIPFPDLMEPECQRIYFGSSNKNRNWVQANPVSGSCS